MSLVVSGLSFSSKLLEVCKYPMIFNCYDSTREFIILNDLTSLSVIIVINLKFYEYSLIFSIEPYQIPPVTTHGCY